MSNPFAAIEVSINQSVSAALGNATLTGSVGSVGGVYDNAYADPFGIANSAPTFLCSAAAVSALDIDAAITIAYAGVATSYSVREKRADGAGLTRLVLQSV